MDWGQAKSIFIVSFLLLNAILGYQLWYKYDDKIETVQLTKNRVQELEQMARLKSIRYKGTELKGEKLPKDAPDLNFLYVEYGDGISQEKGVEGESSKTVVFDPSIELRSPLSVERVTEALQGVYNMANYRYDEYLSKSNQIVYHQLEQDVPMFASTLEIYIQDARITSAKQRSVKVLRQASARKVISAYTAVRTAVESYVPEKSNIVDISIGYHGQQYNSNVQVLAPVWRIALESGSVYYVNAITGVIDTSQSLEIKQNQEND